MLKIDNVVEGTSGKNLHKRERQRYVNIESCRTGNVIILALETT